jgi:type VI secretion system secreted protein VgrG
MSDLPADNRQETQYLGIAIDGCSSAVQISGLSGVERISDIYEYHLQLYVDDPDIDIEAQVGKTAAIRISVTDEDDRHVHGVLAEVAFTNIMPDVGRVFFSAVLRPKLAELDLAADCKIYQNQSVTDIIDAVLADAGITDVSKSLTGTYTARDYCVQWRESTLNFIRRLMEDEGIFFFFRHSDSAHTLVLGDDADAHEDCPTIATLTWSQDLPQAMANDLVHDVRIEKRQITTAVGMRSYHFETPSTDLTGSAEGDTAAPKQHDWGWTHTTTSDGDRLAGVRLGAHEAGQKHIVLTGSNRSLGCGYKVTLESHPVTSFNDSWTLVETRINATPEAFGITARGIPAATVFRAPRQAFRPFIPSTQTAKVVGPSGDEIHTDEYGRVKVKFPWDAVGAEDENASCWIRVAQGWAGSGWGFVFIPRIGMEVVVSFIDGNPDHPLITGCVYNGENSVPYSLPDNQTKSTVKSRASDTDGNFNEIRFDDKADEEEIYVHAQKDMNVMIENDQSVTIGNDQTVEITNDSSWKIENDYNEIVTNNRTRKVSEGNESITIEKGARSLKVGGDEDRTNEGKFTQTVKKDYSLTVEGNLTIEVTGSLKIKAKDFKVEVGAAGSGIALESGGNISLKSTQATKLEATTELGLKGTTGAKLESPAKVEVDGGLKLDCKGTMANFKADGMGEVSAGGILTVKGALVKIN